MQKRCIACPVPMRAEKLTSGEMVITGYGAVFYDGTPATEYNIYDDVVERIAKGAFDDVDLSDVRSFFNHDPNLILGRTKAGTLSLSIDNIGLRYNVTLPETEQGRSIYASVDRGDVDGASFMFSTSGAGGKVSYERGGDKYIRTLEKIATLHEVGPVVFPAYSGASSATRSVADDDCEIKKELADWQAALADKSAIMRAMDAKIKMAKLGL